MIFWVSLGGVLMGLCPDPFRQWWWAWLALIPLWFYTQRVKASTAFGLGLLWGIAYHGMALWWITGVHPMDWLGISWWHSIAIAGLVWLIITLFGALLSALWSGGMALITPQLSTGQKIIIGCALFSGLEVIWSWTPLYWTALGYTQSPDNLLFLQISKISGQQTVTSAIVVVNALLAEGLLASNFRKYLNYFYYALLLGLLISAYGWWELSQNLQLTNSEPLQVGIIQGNIPNPIKVTPEGIKIAVENYTKGYVELARSGVEMVVTPEGAIPLFYPDKYTVREQLDQAIYQYGVPIWLGAFGKDEGGNYTNSLFFITEAQGRPHVSARYNKVRLVPVGEYIPLREVLGGIIRRLSPLQGEVVAGRRDQLVDSPWGRMIVGICYESAYPEHFRYQARAGGRLILTASNNAHYAPAMPAQHHAQDVARAIETDRWAVRATNTGYSGIVDPKGRTIWQSGINTYEVHAGVIYLRDTTTLYVWLGDWLTPLLCFLSSGICAQIFIQNFTQNRENRLTSR